ncbi:MAG: hypothetical protein N3B16_10980 [Candidatus Aminicenantes bacterium]|nr:hypothetical protein [Candidatus Aminicenantes bacterium]
MTIKKTIIVSLAFFMIIFPLACTKKARLPQAGQAKALNLIQLLPKNTLGIFAFDVKRSLDTSLAQYSLEDKEISSKIEEFKNHTGIDLNKDIYLIAGGIIAIDQKEPQPVIMINLHYYREKLVNLIRQKIPQAPIEIVYGKTTIYKLDADKGPNSGFAFYDNSNIFLGSLEALEKLIDVCEGKAENLQQNHELNSLLKKTKTEALSWSAFLLPAEAMTEVAKANPMLSPLQKLRSLILSFDYKNKNLIAEIKAMGSEEAYHKQLADFFTGLRAMGVMATTNYPEVSELLNRIEIISTAEQVGLNFSLPEDLLIKLSDRLKKEVEAKLPQGTKQNF